MVRYPRIEKVEERLFEGEESVLHVIERIVAPLGLRVDGSSPWVDARLPDGSRVQTKILCTHYRADLRQLAATQSGSRLKSDPPITRVNPVPSDLIT